MSDRFDNLRPLFVATAVTFGALVILVAVPTILLEGSLTQRLATLDELLFNAVCGACAAADPSLLSEVVRDVTALGSLTVGALVTLTVALFLVAIGRARVAVYLVMTIAIGAALTFLLKRWTARPRPEAPPGAPIVASTSFPSGHAATAALVYLSCTAVLMPLLRSSAARVVAAGLATLLMLAVGTSRVWLGLHYPSDVVVGWFLGGGWTMLALVIYGRLSRPPVDP